MSPNPVYVTEGTAAFSGMRALVTGGTTGIGRAIAYALARDGAEVMICGRHQAELDDALATAPDDRGEIVGSLADLAELPEVVRLFDEVDRTFGRIDLLVNNAAVSAQSVAETSLEQVSYVVRTNLIAYMACAREAILRMKNNPDGGTIINVGSMSADEREEGSSVYVATKAGIQGFSAALRKEVNAMGISVTLIEPGKTGSDMQPQEPEEQRRLEEKEEMLTAEDVAAAVVFCLSQPKRSSVVELKLRPLQQRI